MVKKKAFINPKLQGAQTQVTFTIDKSALILRLKAIMTDEGNFEKVRVAAARALYKLEPQTTVNYLEKITKESPNAAAQVMSMVILLKLQEGTVDDEA